MRTVRIAAKAYDGALRFCNARLREQKLPLIKKLPPGEAANPYNCPCGKATGCIVNYTHWRYDQTGSARTKGHPTAFVTAFDAASPSNILIRPIRGLRS